MAIWLDTNSKILVQGMTGSEGTGQFAALAFWANPATILNAEVLGYLDPLLMLPALTNSFILSFIRGIESFESPLFFGTPAKITVVTTEIYNSIHHHATPDYQYATAISFRAWDESAGTNGGTGNSCALKR